MSDASIDSSTPVPNSKLAALKSTAHAAVDDAADDSRVLAAINLLWGNSNTEDVAGSKTAAPKPHRPRSKKSDALGILIRQSMNDPAKVTWSIDELYEPHRASESMPQGEANAKNRINQLLSRAAAHTFMRVPGDTSRWLLRKRYNELTKPK